MTREELIGAVARGWCHDENSSKTMDSDLAMAIVEEVEKELDKMVLSEDVFFTRIWEAIKHWDVDSGSGYSHTTGDDVRVIMDAMAAEPVILQIEKAVTD